ncbi:MAG: hypothetical protein WC764_03600 [Candidatus Paceibacterota bacterium]
MPTTTYWPNNQGIGAEVNMDEIIGQESTQRELVKSTVLALWENRSEDGTLPGELFRETLETLRLAGKYRWAKDILRLKFTSGTVKLELGDLLGEMETVIRAQGANKKTYSFTQNNLGFLLSATRSYLLIRYYPPEA